jgi:hypothetical protein
MNSFCMKLHAEKTPRPLFLIIESFRVSHFLNVPLLKTTRVLENDEFSYVFKDVTLPILTFLETLTTSFNVVILLQRFVEILLMLAIFKCIGIAFS